MISNNGDGGKATLFLNDRTFVWQGRKIVCLDLIGCIAKGAGMGSRFSSVVLVSVWFTSFRYDPRWTFRHLANKLRCYSIGFSASAMRLSPNSQLGVSTAKDSWFRRRNGETCIVPPFYFSCFVF
jgi:hypothetical protein